MRVPQSPPIIKPIQLENRPTWSVMIPVYNSITYLKETLQSVLQQALPESEMQIEVVDDCSTDGDVAALVEILGKGRIGYYRQPLNVGSLRNFETCLNRSKGHYVHLLHSDDLVHSGFYTQLTSLFKKYPEAGAAYCRFAYINDQGEELYLHEAEAKYDGLLDNWLFRLAERQRIQYVSIAVKREVYEQLGSFYGVHYGEDWEMWVRIAAHYPFVYTPNVLASYRMHQQSISGQSFLSAQNLRDLEFVMCKIAEYLPEGDKSRILSKSKKFYAHYAIRTANKLWHNLRSKKGAWAQILHAWHMHRDLQLAYKTSKLLLKMALNK